MMDLREISLIDITPSPYQVRKHFSEQSLRHLADSIARDTLVEPIVVREQQNGYELIVGERRWRAVKRIPQYETILARIVDVTDTQARRMNAAENMQREDLSAIETIEALVEVIDAEMIDEPGYAALDEGSVNRVRTLLVKLDSDYKNETDYFRHKFVSKIESVFAALPKPMEWRSFFNHDLPLITKIEPEVRQAAIEYQLNKSQAKELDHLKQVAPAAYNRVVKTGVVDPIQDLGEIPKVIIEEHVDTEGNVTTESHVIIPEPVPLREASARDLQRVGRHATIANLFPHVETRTIAQNWLTTLNEVKGAISHDMDRLKIIIESINREGGFDGLTEKWQRQDVIQFCLSMVNFGELLSRTGGQLLQRIGAENEHRTDEKAI